MKEKIAFVILHYQTIDETINCVESIIEKIDTKNYEIIIVDNGSPNKSGNILNKKYKSIKNIHVIINDKNLGFSSGNNIGFKYAKKLNCDFIAMINNDTCLITDNFFEIILKEYKKSNFAVMGPKILLKDSEVCTMNGKLITINRLKKYLRNLKIKLFLNYLHMDSLFLKIKKNVENQNEDISYVDKRREDVVLHGCCLIFSPVYIKKFDGLDEKTFLYCEEELLYLKLKSNNMLSVYNPKLLIYHDEGVATKSMSKSNYKKRRFRYKKLIEANKILLDEMNNIY